MQRFLALTIFVAAAATSGCQTGTEGTGTVASNYSPHCISVGAPESGYCSRPNYGITYGPPLFPG